MLHFVGFFKLGRCIQGTHGSPKEKTKVNAEGISCLCLPFGTFWYWHHVTVSWRQAEMKRKGID